MPYKDSKGRVCGVVDIEEKEKSAKFVRRYLRLDKSIGVIEWFTDDPTSLPKSLQPEGSIDINFITKVDVPIKIKFKAKHCFFVHTPPRRYYFQGIDDEDMRAWVEVIDNASKIVVSSDDDHTVEEFAKTSDHDPETSTDADGEFSYMTKIVAGVIIQKKMANEDTFSSAIVNGDSKSLKGASPSDGGSPKKADTVSGTLIKQGWGVKQGHVRKNWKRRFFILTTKGFSYFKSDHEKEPIRSIAAAEILTAKKDSSSLSENRDNLLFVATTERIYYIQSDSHEEMVDWIKSFHEAIHFSNSVKRKSKDIPGRKPTDPVHGSPTKTAQTTRKLEVSHSMASPSLRNSAYIGSSLVHSTATFRLSCADEAFYGSFSPGAAVTKPKVDRQFRVASSSEDSGLCGSVDSLSTPLNHGRAVAQSQLPSEKSARAHGKERLYHRSCSGTEIIATNVDRAAIPPVQSTNVPYVTPTQGGSPQKSNVRGSVSVSNTSSPRSSGSFSSVKSLKPTKSFMLDPNVDHRAAVKPSTVKKKRNTGILFTLNNMLHRKAEKMNVEKRKCDKL